MTMANKKLVRSIIVASSILVLAGCNSDIKATPTFYKDPIVDSEEDLTHNVMKTIYDALSDSSANKEKVLNKVLAVLADDYFGDFETAKALSNKQSVDEKAKAFFEKHEYYNAKDEDGNDKYTDAEKLLKLKHFVSELNKRINESFYNEISGGSYAYRNKFDEERYVNYLKGQLYDIDGLQEGEVWHKDILITKAYKEDVSSVLHLAKYHDYIDRNLLPKFYRQLIVEEFMYTENYSLLSRSNARKIEYIKLEQNSEYPTAARKLLVEFSKKYIEKESNGEVNLDLIGEAWNGNFFAHSDPEEQSEAEKLLVAAQFDTEELVIDGETKTVYPATKFGKLMKQYSKITDDRYTTENESTFTSDNTYPKEIGLQLKVDEITLTSYTEEGWYYKNGSSPSLPSDVTKRLFEMGVANDVDYLGITTDENGYVTKRESSVPYEPGNYVTKKNGNFWLVPAVSQKIDDDPYNYILTENSGDTAAYYLVRVEEAVATSKLSTLENNRYNYAHLRSEEGSMFTEFTAREIAKLYNSNDTYRKQSYVKLLKDASIKYHDQDIYDYFKENYPNLFEED